MQVETRGFKIQVLVFRNGDRIGNPPYSCYRVKHRDLFLQKCNRSYADRFETIQVSIFHLYLAQSVKVKNNFIFGKLTLISVANYCMGLNF